MFLSCGNPHGLFSPGGGEGVWEPRLTITTLCPLLSYAGGAVIVRTFTAPPVGTVKPLLQANYNYACVHVPYGKILTMLKSSRRTIIFWTEGRQNHQITKSSKTPPPAQGGAEGSVWRLRTKNPVRSFSCPSYQVRGSYLVWTVPEGTMIFKTSVCICSLQRKRKHDDLNSCNSACI